VTKHNTAVTARDKE